ncbi:hypothetical protein SLE2022_000180 [Rubroshorea leprosula]
MAVFKFWAVLALVVVAEGRAEETSSYLNQLAPCLNYLNGNEEVADSCCDPLKSVIKSNPECLCSLISNKGSSEAEQAGINFLPAPPPNKSYERVARVGGGSEAQGPC